MANKMTVVLPCRKGSKRIVRKNTKKFYSYEMGLFELKIYQLSHVKSIDCIHVSTDDELIINYVEKNYKKFKKEVTVEKRPAHLAEDDCLVELITYLAHSVQTETLVWTHVTSPFFQSQDYEKAIQLYQNNIARNSFDSLVSVSAVHTFAMQNGKWISHDISKKKWPRKQDVKKILLINGAVYIINIDLMKKKKDRLGDNPFYYELHGLTGFDIDYEEDFFTAEKIAPCLLTL